MSIVMHKYAHKLSVIDNSSCYIILRRLQLQSYPPYFLNWKALILQMSVCNVYCTLDLLILSNAGAEML